MAVPDTNTFSLQDVVDEINPTTDDLQDCINDAIEGKYDTNYYTAPATSLLEFRNYGSIPWGVSSILENSNSPVALSTSILGTNDFAGVPLFIDEGGTRFYVKDHAEGKIIQASIASSHDITSTISYVNSSPAYFTLLSNTLLFSSDGTKMYYGTVGDLREYTLSTAWDITTVSNTINASVSTPASSQYGGYCFNAAGTTLYSAYKTAGNVVYISYWTLSTAFNLSTVSSRTDNNVTTTVGGSFILSSTDLLDSAVNNEDIIMIGGSGFTYAFKGGVTNSDFYSSGLPTGGQFRSSLNKNYLYQLLRTGPGGNYVWSLEQFNTNV